MAGTVNEGDQRKCHKQQQAIWRDGAYLLQGIRRNIKQIVQASCIHMLKLIRLIKKNGHTATITTVPRKLHKVGTEDKPQ